MNVGIAPVALAETPNGQKVYVANQGDNGTNGSVSSISTVDKSVNLTIAGATWLSPRSVAVRSDSQRAYALDTGNSTLTAINTSTDAVTGVVPASSIGAGRLSSPFAPLPAAMLGSMPRGAWSPRS